MSIHSIGIYINVESKEEYEILEECPQISEPASSRIRILPIKRYITKCGIRARKVSDDLASFTLNGTVVHKINT